MSLRKHLRNARKATNYGIGFHREAELPAPVATDLTGSPDSTKPPATEPEEGRDGAKA